jgi:UDP-2,3-diacylglucosamine hydrolase
LKRLFISDLHLQSERPEITRALRFFLSEVAPGSDELYLLGDIFEAWIGDDAIDPTLNEISPLFTELAKQGTAIFFQAGNRDFLVGEKTAKLLSATLLDELVIITLPQGNALIAHGDQFCIDDHDYQAFRKMVRNTDWQQQFLAKSLDERQAIARHLRDESGKQNSNKEDYIMDVSPCYCAEVVKEKQCSLLIHGHTHRPAVHGDINGNEELKRIVLGDWSESGWYLLSDDQQLELIKFEPSKNFK